MIQQTLSQLRALYLEGMARALEEQMANPQIDALAFEQRVAMLVDRELLHRDSRRLRRLLKQARFKISEACLENLKFSPGRGLAKAQVAALATCDWVRAHHSVLISGATGVGKTYLACALGNAACRQGFSALYVRLPRLLEELKTAHGEGSFGRYLAQLAKIDAILIDDWGLAPLSQPERNDLLEVLDDRVSTRSTIITSQLPFDTWHDYLQEPTVADAILDRIVHQAHKFKLTGKSMRDPSQQ
jgi:DNA replication protein DnaC